jgi:prepilin-type N-terminal cleavage/methylation domain-containing protein
LKRDTNKGFSLIELLIAITIMSIVMLMVIQFMGTTSGALNKTRKKLDLQTKAMEFREQFSDIMMQATYVRVESADKCTYTVDTALNDKNRKKRDVYKHSGTIQKYLVSDGYPNLLKAQPRNLDIYYDQSDYTLFGVDNDAAGKPQYPTTINTEIQSFRVLENKITCSNCGQVNDWDNNKCSNCDMTLGHDIGKTDYVIPKYIYVRYQPDVVNNVEKYAIFLFKDNKVYMAKGEIANFDTYTSDGMSAAVSAVNSKASADEAVLADNVKDFYFSADTGTNSVNVNLQLENTKYTVQTYDYSDTIKLRNTYALTVAPNKMYKKK